MKAMACMGGWKCLRRERCAHYHAEHRWMPAERLCSPGQFDQWLPLPAAQLPKTSDTPQPLRAEVTT